MESLAIPELAPPRRREPGLGGMDNAFVGAIVGVHHQRHPALLAEAQLIELLSGKPTRIDGKPPGFMDKSTIDGHFQ